MGSPWLIARVTRFFALDALARLNTAWTSMLVSFEVDVRRCHLRDTTSGSINRIAPARVQCIVRRSDFGSGLARPRPNGLRAEHRCRFGPRQIYRSIVPAARCSRPRTVLASRSSCDGKTMSPHSLNTVNLVVSSGVSPWHRANRSWESSSDAGDATVQMRWDTSSKNVRVLQSPSPARTTRSMSAVLVVIHPPSHSDPRLSQRDRMANAQTLHLCPLQLDISPCCPNQGIERALPGDLASFATVEWSTRARAHRGLPHKTSLKRWNPNVASKNLFDASFRIDIGPHVAWNTTSPLSSQRCPT